MIETRNAPLAAIEVRDTKASGLAAPFNSDSQDLGGFIERIAPGAFSRSLREAEAGDLNIFGLWSHDSACPLASTRSGKLKLTESDAGLQFEMDVSRMNEAQRSALEDGDLQKSFGFRVREDSWEQRSDGMPIRTLIDVDLSEVSFVIFPAYPATEAALRSMDAWKEEQRAAAPKIEDRAEFNPAAMIKRALVAHWDARNKF